MGRARVMAAEACGGEKELLDNNFFGVAVRGCNVGRRT